MARIKIQDIRDNFGGAELYDIANSIMTATSHKDYSVLANADNIAEFGAGIINNSTLRNEFINTLVERIGLVVVRQKLLSNPLSFMKKGVLGMGRSIEEIYTDVTQAQKYDPEDAEDTVFKRTIPNVKTLFHEVNRQEMYPTTVQEDTIKSAFVSWEKFGEFIASILQTLHNSAEKDEYRYMMLLIDNYYAKNHFKVIQTPEISSSANAKEFTKLVREHGTLMTMPQGTRDYNSLAVHTTTEEDELYLIITAKAKATLDVDVLAAAFNLNPAQTIGRTIVVDKFADANIQAVLVDETFFMVYDRLQQMTNQYNGKGLYTNYFYHIWQVMSVSRFANAVAFVSGAVEPITEVIVSPSISTLKAGRTLQMQAYVRQTDNANHAVTWTVEPSTSASTLAAGTEISSTGLLTFGAQQLGEVLVKATTTYGTGEEAVSVVGEAIITAV